MERPSLGHQIPRALLGRHGGLARRWRGIYAVNGPSFSAALEELHHYYRWTVSPTRLAKRLCISVGQAWSVMGLVPANPLPLANARGWQEEPQGPSSLCNP